MKDSSKKSSNLENGATLNQDRGELLNFKWGTLSIEEIRGILDALPMDLNFIDKDDLVQYYNESPGQVHKRNLDVFKKSVLLCHSESSKKKVEATLKALRMGKRCGHIPR